MLSDDDRSHDAARLIASLPSLIDLPAQWRDTFDKHGLSCTVEANQRRFPRIHCRSHRNQAGLQCLSTLPQLAREPVWHGVYVSNMSREGVSFLHSEALYPLEQMRIIILSGQCLRLEVIRCRRLNTACFEVGARIVAREDWPADFA